MKRNISDLLDRIPVDDLEPGTPTPLSGLRIKRMTLDQIPRKRRPCWVGRAAVIAAVIMALSVTAFAVDTIINDGAMFASIANTITGNQPTTVSNDGTVATDVTETGNQPIIDTVEDGWSEDDVKISSPIFTGTQEELMADVQRSFDVILESNGTTITPIRAIADEENYLLYLRVEAPEGVVLPDLTDGFYYEFGYRGKDEYEMGIRCKHQGYGYTQDRILYDTYSWGEISFLDSAYPLEDEDPTDNVKEFAIRFRTHGGLETFNGGEEKWLDIRCLSIVKKHSADKSEDKIILRGEFSFEITHDNENRRGQSLVIKTGDLTYHNEEFDYTTTVHKVTIRPLSIELECTYTTPNEKYIFPYGGPVQLVMKDGRIIDALDAYDDARSLSCPCRDDIVGVSSYNRFWDPIVVGDIDYILFNGEISIDIN